MKHLIKTLSIILLMLFVNSSSYAQCDVAPTNFEEYKSCNHDIAQTWRPIFNQWTKKAKYDTPTAVNFDNNWNAGDNWNSAGDLTAPPNISAYYHVVWTENYWIIVYSYYYPRDWSDRFGCGSDEHEGDTERVIVHVDRQTKKMHSVATTHHSDLDVRNCASASLPSSQRPNVFSSAGSHAIYLTKKEAKDDKYKGFITPCNPCGRWRCDDSDLIQHTNYPLYNIFVQDKLYDHRDDPLVFLEDEERFVCTEGNCGNASAPWNGDTGLNPHLKVDEPCNAPVGDELYNRLKCENAIFISGTQSACLNTRKYFTLTNLHFPGRPNTNNILDVQWEYDEELFHRTATSDIYSIFLRPKNTTSPPSSFPSATITAHIETMDCGTITKTLAIYNASCPQWVDPTTNLDKIGICGGGRYNGIDLLNTNGKPVLNELKDAIDLKLSWGVTYDYLNHDTFFFVEPGTDVYLENANKLVIKKQGSGWTNLRFFNASGQMRLIRFYTKTCEPSTGPGTTPVLQIDVPRETLTTAGGGTTFTECSGNIKIGVSNTGSGYDITLLDNKYSNQINITATTSNWSWSPALCSDYNISGIPTCQSQNPSVFLPQSIVDTGGSTIVIYVQGGATCDFEINLSEVTGISTGNDSDGDGVSDSQDCAPDNPNIPASPGSPCNDGNSNTTNDVILSDECSCAGTPATTCPEETCPGLANIQVCDDEIIIEVLSSTVTMVDIQNSNWTPYATPCNPWYGDSCVSTGTITVPITAGKIYRVKIFSANGAVCERLVGGGVRTKNADKLENAQDQIAITPNPTNGQFSLVGVNNFDFETTLDIYDISGRKVVTEIVANGNVPSADVSHLMEGIYIVTLTKTDGELVYRGKLSHL